MDTLIPYVLEPGIYFDLPDEVYFDEPALSRSDIVALLDTPNTYWKNSWMNPDRKKRKTSDAMDYGSAFDCLMFTPKLFEQKYQVVPIDAWAEHKEKISYADYFAIIESIKVLRGAKESKRWLSGGLPQVTIVFEEYGRRFRTRHDYFTPVLSTDFKTARALHDEHLKRAFREYGYDIQLRLYKRARERFKEQYAAGKASPYGEVPIEFFRKFIEADINEFIFIFQRSTPPHPFESKFPEDDTEENGLHRIEKAMRIFEKNWAQYGTSEWPVCDGKTKSFSMFYGTREEE